MNSPSILAAASANTFHHQSFYSGEAAVEGTDAAWDHFHDDHHNEPLQTSKAQNMSMRHMMMKKKDNQDCQ